MINIYQLDNSELFLLEQSFNFMTYGKEKRCDILTFFSSHLFKMISILTARDNVPDTILSIIVFCVIGSFITHFIYLLCLLRKQ